MSLETAKQVTAAFSAAAPPRTIDDVLAVLDSAKPDAGALAARRAQADAAPPAGLSHAELAEFYVRRGRAARYLLRSRQAVDDLTQATTLVPGNPRYMNTHAVMLLYAGYPRQALAEWEASTKLTANYSAPYGYMAQVHAQLGDAAAADADLRVMEEIFRSKLSQPATARDWVWVLETIRRANTGITQFFLGRYREAEATLEAAKPFADGAIRNWNNAVLSRDADIESYEQTRIWLDIYLSAVRQQRGAPVAAELDARKALADSLREFGSASPMAFYATVRLARAILEQGRYEDAERLTRWAIDVFGAGDPGNRSTALAKARLLLADSLGAQGRSAEALGLFETVRDMLSDDPALLRQTLGADLDYADALLSAGRADDALTIAREAERQAGANFGDKSPDAAFARGVGAMALAAKDERAAALAAFADVISALEAYARRAQEQGQVSHLRIIREVFDRYLELLDAVAGTPLEARVPGGAVATAFRVADQAHGGAVQTALANATARAALPAPELAALARRDQDAALEAAALEQTLIQAVSLPASERDEAALARLRQQIATLRAAEDQLRHEIYRRFPSYQQLLEPAPAGIEAARASLRPDEALIAIHVGARATLVWAVPKQGAVAYARVPLGAAAIAEAVKHLRAALDPQVTRLRDIPGFDVAAAQRLYAALLQPVEAGWRGAASLVVVPDKALAQLPFGALVVRPASLPQERQGQALFAAYKTVPWLARDVALTQEPSVSALVALRGLPPAAVGRKAFVGFGDPWFSRQQADAAHADGAVQLAAVAGETVTRGVLRLRSAPQTATLESADLAALPRLPETADEVREIARALRADPTADVFVGAAANERNAKAALGGRAVIVFATHGLVPGDLDGLAEPALALSAPQVSGVEGDGLLTMDEILGLKLDADWVVLSACNTAAGEGGGAQAVSGLGRAFFYAGARALLVSNWPVETTSARALTTGLFRRQAETPGIDRAQALRGVELALIDGDGLVDAASGRVVFSYAHPIFWAPFSLIGDGAGAR